MNNIFLELPKPTKKELVEKQKECFNAILKVIENKHYTEIDKLRLISYYSKQALDDTIMFKNFKIQ